MKLTDQTLFSDTASTTSFSRLRGMTLWIMAILRDGGSVASWQVAEQTMKTCRYVNVYLFRLRKYGVAEKNEEFWFLTDFGEYLTDLLIGQYTDRYRYRYKYNTRTTQQQHNNNTTPKKKPVQVSIQAWLRDSSPGDAERGVVDLLVYHFNKTGSKFVLVKDHYAMSELLKINVNDVPDVLTNLRQENIIYLMRDPTSGMWKLGLKKAFLELLERDGLK
jgi:hypothetical protein